MCCHVDVPPFQLLGITELLRSAANDARLHRVSAVYEALPIYNAMYVYNDQGDDAADIDEMRSLLERESYTVHDIMNEHEDVRLGDQPVYHVVLLVPAAAYTPEAAAAFNVTVLLVHSLEALQQIGPALLPHETQQRSSPAVVLLSP